jgi:hypothetical protein
MCGREGGWMCLTQMLRSRLATLLAPELIEFEDDWVGRLRLKDL